MSVRRPGRKRWERASGGALPVLVVFSTLLIVDSETASACSMVPRPYLTPATADYAFIGTLVSQDPPHAVPLQVEPPAPDARRERLGPPRPMAPTYRTVTVRFRYRVDEVVKGTVGTKEVEFERTYEGGPCGPPSTPAAALGKRTGVLVGLLPGGAVDERTFDDFHRPDRLRKESLPRHPDPSVDDASFVASGSFGPAYLATLDQAGRVRAYGGGRGWIKALSVCPGGRRLLEVTLVEPGTHELIVRDVEHLRVLRRLPLRQGADLLHSHPTLEVSCRTETGGQADLLAVSGQGIGVLSSIDERGIRTVAYGLSGPVAFDRQRQQAYAISGQQVVRIDLGTGRVSPLAPAHGATALALSPNGRLLALTAQRDADYRTARLELLDVTTRKTVRAGTIGVEGRVASPRWVGDDELAIAAQGRAVVYDTRFRPLRTLPYNFNRPAVLDGRMYSVDVVVGKERQPKLAGRLKVAPVASDTGPAVLRTYDEGFRPEDIVAIGKNAHHEGRACPLAAVALSLLVGAGLGLAYRKRHRPSSAIREVEDFGG